MCRRLLIRFDNHARPYQLLAYDLAVTYHVANDAQLNRPVDEDRELLLEQNRKTIDKAIGRVSVQQRDISFFLFTSEDNSKGQSGLSKAAFRSIICIIKA